ncbi:peptidoglycan editing factor PgeF [Ramlibacter sp. AN1133]|uniref:peptidoglycan editing factor PgeF n=1 Tax=Ramlibacter sp. AN1133 TaxID=3133429 RepID=UPI0030C24DD9
MTPEWPAPAGVRAFCSERDGGVSAPPYDTLNLGDHVGDDEAAVQENRRRYAVTLQARPVFLKQVHGQGVVRLDAATPDQAEADACWTTERGVACTMMVADCLPVLLADRRGTIVGAAHCGWRGLAGGVLEALWTQMAPTAGAARDAIAWIGPCIGPDAFEVGPEVRAAFLAQDTSAADLFRPHAEGKFLADLPALARRRLAAMGITAVHGNDGSRRWCTVANASRFFSHRRDRVSGRFAASVWLA